MVGRNVLTRKYDKQPIADGQSRGARWKISTGPKREGAAAPSKEEGAGGPKAKGSSPKHGKE